MLYGGYPHCLPDLTARPAQRYWVAGEWELERVVGGVAPSRSAVRSLEPHFAPEGARAPRSVRWREVTTRRGCARGSPGRRSLPGPEGIFDEGDEDVFTHSAAIPAHTVSRALGSSPFVAVDGA